MTNLEPLPWFHLWSLKSTVIFQLCLIHEYWVWHWQYPLNVIVKATILCIMLRWVSRFAEFFSFPAFLLVSSLFSSHEIQGIGSFLAALHCLQYSWGNTSMVNHVTTSYLTQTSFLVDFKLSWISRQWFLVRWNNMMS